MMKSTLLSRWVIRLRWCVTITKPMSNRQRHSTTSISTHPAPSLRNLSRTNATESSVSGKKIDYWLIYNGDAPAVGNPKVFLPMPTHFKNDLVPHDVLGIAPAIVEQQSGLGKVSRWVTPSVIS